MIFHSSFEQIYLVLPIIGFLIGLFGTMLGGGGGFFFLPILALLIGVPPHIAVATSLTATLPICIVGTFGHRKRGNIDLKTGTIFAFAGIIGALIGASITGYLSEKQLKVGFGIYSILIALNMMRGTWLKKRAEKQDQIVKPLSKIEKVSKGSFFGIAAGMIAGTFGTSGTAPVLAGLFALRLPLKMVIGTSLMIVLVNTIFATGAHFLVGQIDLTVVYFLTAGSVVGAISGPRLLTKIKVEKSENNVQYIYALVMVAIGILMIVSK